MSPQPDVGASKLPCLLQKRQAAADEEMLLKKEARRAERIRARVLRKRAKRKAKHLENLRARGIDPDAARNKPDPERWIRRQDRSNARKYKKRRGAKMTGGQGVGDTMARDASKFDAAALAKVRAEEEAKKAAEQKAANEANKKSQRRRRRAKRRGEVFTYVAIALSLTILQINNN